MSELIWKWFDHSYKVHCRERADYDRMMRWKGSIHGGSYSMPDGTRAWDVIIEGRHYNRACRVLGLPQRPKSPGRVAAGVQQSPLLKQHTFSRRS